MATTPTGKARPPRARGSLVARPRLFTLLAEPRPVTLISAPAGYGKTVLVASWLDTLDLPRAWLTLAARHRAPEHFAADLTAALRPLLPAAAETPAQPQRALPDLAGSLSAALTDLIAPALVILDGCHMLEGSETHALISRIALRLPRQVRLILLSRRDPPLALASLRAHGLLTEVRTNALRFTAAETKTLLQQTPGAPSDDAAVALLLEATEGWITGMVLAIPSLRDQAEIGAALARLHQGNSPILEYLTAEVLEQEPPQVQEFLVKTSLLDRLHPALCAALVDAAGKGQDCLRVLIDNNLFVHAVAEDAGWMRYARFFRDALRIHLQRRYPPAEIARLHRRAGAWFAEAGMIEEALRHAVAGGDATAAIQWVAQRRHGLMNGEEWSTLQRWLDCFDRAAITNSPDLALAEAWLLLNQGRIQELDPLLARAERMLTTAAAPAALYAEVAALRSHQLLVAGQPEAVIAQVSQTTAMPVTAQYARSAALFSQAAALQMAGDLSQAGAVLDDALIWPQSYPSAFHVRVLAAQCQVQWLAADLPAMLRAARQVLLISAQLRLAQMHTWGAYYAGAVYYVWNELERAAEVLEPAVRQPAASQAIAYANASCALAATYQAQGRAAEANAVLNAAIDFLRMANRHYLPLVLAFAAELALRQQDAGRAAQLIVQQPVAQPAAPAFHFLAPQLARPKVLLALGQPAARQEAAALLDAAQRFFAATHNTRFLIETQALLALLHEADNRRADALAALKAALRQAAPGGLVRIFADSGPRLAPLLDVPALRDDTPALVNQIRAALRGRLPNAPQTLPHPQPTGQGAEPPGAGNVELVEALTSRELDVLAALAEHLTSREIAERLGVSVHTIKQHIGNIIGKLEVADRRQAVARARALGLLK